MSTQIQLTHACGPNSQIPLRSNAIIKHGVLSLQQPGGTGGRQNVSVYVYRTSLEHFAVIFSKRGRASVVNLKKTTAQRKHSCGFTLRQTGFDNALSAQFVCAERDLDGWLAAFSPLKQRVQSRMPALTESEEP